MCACVTLVDAKTLLLNAGCLYSEHLTEVEMTSSSAQNTDFSRDILGRYTCNGLDEALQSTNTALRPDARPFDVVIIGGGSFAGVLAQHLFTADTAHRHRI